MRPSNCIDILYKADGDIMFALRSAAYKKRYGDNVDISALKWNSWDYRYLNLGVFSDGQLVSMMRISYVNNQTDYQTMMLCDFDSNKYGQLPIVIINRLATAENFEGLGLNSLLRYYALQIAKKANIQFVMGSIAKEGARLKQLQEMGYEFSENPAPWDNFLKSNDPTYIISLDLKQNFNRAIDRLKLTASELITKYPAVYREWNSDLIFREERYQSDLLKLQTVV